MVDQLELVLEDEELDEMVLDQTEQTVAPKADEEDQAEVEDALLEDVVQPEEMVAEQASAEREAEGERSEGGGTAAPHADDREMSSPQRETGVHGAAEGAGSPRERRHTPSGSAEPERSPSAAPHADDRVGSSPQRESSMHDDAEGAGSPRERRHTPPGSAEPERSRSRSPSAAPHADDRGESSQREGAGSPRERRHSPVGSTERSPGGGGGGSGEEQRRKSPEAEKAAEAGLLQQQRAGTAQPTAGGFPSSPPRCRYFLVRALCPENVMCSVTEGAWACTTKHMEDKFNAAYLAGEVRLLVVVQDSPCFSGWAIMRSKIGHLGRTVPWPMRGEPGRLLGPACGVEWRCLYDLAASELRGLTNSMDGGRPLLAGKDGGELPESMGAKVVAMLDEQAADAGVPPPKKQVRMAMGRGRGMGPGPRGDDMSRPGPRDVMVGGRGGMDRPPPGPGLMIGGPPPGHPQGMMGGRPGMGPGPPGMPPMPGSGMGPMMGMMGYMPPRSYPGAPPPPPPRRDGLVGDAPPAGRVRSPSPVRDGPDLVSMSYDEYLEAYRCVKTKMEALMAAEAAARPPLLGAPPPVHMLPGALPGGLPPQAPASMAPGMMGMGPGGMMGMGPGRGMAPGMMGPGGMGPVGMMGGGGGMMGGGGAPMAQQRPPGGGGQPYSEAEYVALTINHFKSQGKLPPSEDFIRQHYKASLMGVGGR
ncbi:hypothetical protein FOA52_008951 [Chlamydomonas sp. UWO 241]|nr:hypothetical protein FOA52_008951 [Chlamydomonas sp. UWO 241]